MSVLVTRRTRVLAVLLVAVLSFSALPSIAIGGDAVPTVSAAAQDYEVKIGWMSDILNWNPMYIAMVEDWVACFLMYSGLWQYDQDWAGSSPDLVLSYNTTYHGDGSMTMWLNLTHNAYFRNALDPDDTSMGLTAYDVTYTFWVACSKTNTAWEYYMRDYDAAVVDDYTVRLDIPFVKANAIDDLTGVPIVPSGFYNGSIALADAMAPEECLGSGPFVFDSMLEASWWKFKVASNYHGSADFGDERTVKVTYLTYQLSSESSILAADMNAGSLDVAVLTGEPDVYLGVLVPTTDNQMIRESVQELGICDIAFNAVPLEFRVNAPGEGNDYCDGNLHLLDRNVRQALGMTLDKAYIKAGIMKNLSTTAISVIPPSFWQADIQNALSFDTTGARNLLLASGYYDDGGDFLVAGAGSYVVDNGLLPAGSRLEGLRCQAPNTDPSWSRIAMYWLGTAALAGIGFDPDLTGVENEAYMTNEAWYKCMYDIWVWHWGWGPEPLSDLSVWMTSEIVTGGDNCEMPMGEWYVHGDMDVDADGTIDYPENYTSSPYVDADMIAEYNMEADGFRGFSSFDENFSRAMKTVDLYDRLDVVCDLQQTVYDSYSEFPPYYDVGLYAYNTLRYQGWGDWSEHSGRTVVSGMPWVWFDLIPAGNMIPAIEVGLSNSYDLDTGELGTFSITVSDADNDKLWVNWSFGDGTTEELEFTSTSTSFTVSVDHQYSTAGTYPLSVTVTDGYASHEVSDSASVVVSLPATAKPVIAALSYTPLEAYVGEETTWTCTVTDADSSAITVTFAWGDGTYTVDPYSGTPGTAIPVEAVHTYDAASTYTVNIYANDGSNNESVSRSYTVIANTAPTAPVVSAVSTVEGASTPISASTSDADPDTLIVTWDWGDGTYDVTTHDTSSDPGAMVVSSVTHTWDTAGTYTFVVWADDQAGHNVSSATITATVGGVSDPVAPSISSFLQIPYPGIVDETVTLTIGAFDANSDALDFYVEFGDGEAATDSTTGGSGTQTIVLTHVYTAVGDYTVTVYVNDGTFNVSSDPPYTVPIVAPEENALPEVVLMTAYSAMYNETFEITPTQVFDADGDDVSVWYDWGDDTELSEGDVDAAYKGTHMYSVTGNVTLTAYADDNTGLDGHNVSATTTVTVSANRRPEVKLIEVSPLSGPYHIGETLTFNVTVSDREGNEVTIKVDFGDDSAIQSKTETPSAAGANVTVTFTHSYEGAETYTVTAWAEDAYDHPDPAWLSLERTIIITEQEQVDDQTNWLLIAGIGVLILAVVVIAVLLLKKRKGKSEEGGAGESSGGGMEGMAPPE